jgi:hypothetical protein
MNNDFYKKALDTAIKDLADLMTQREELDNKREEIDRQISHLRSGIFGLSPLCGITVTSMTSDYPDLFPDMIDPEVGLTDAVREILKSTRVFITPVRVRDKLKEAGFDLDKYKNVLASIHTVLKRLYEANEIEMSTREGKTLYRWKKRGVQI